MVTYGEVATAGIDFITATGTSRSSRIFLAEYGRILVDGATQAGNDKKPWRGMGYEGVRAGGISVGDRPDSTILRFSGPGDAGVCREIVERADNISRVDLQTTVRFRRDVPRLATSHAAEVRAKFRDYERKPHAQLINTFGRGDTLTVGSRSSNYYGRVYDKHRESGREEYRRCWRYEVELKGAASRAFAQRIRTEEEVTEEIPSLVHSWFSRNGCSVRYRPGLAHSFETGHSVPTDAQKRLKWLQVAVGPSFRWLQTWYARDQLVELLDGHSTSEELPGLGTGEANLISIE